MASETILEERFAALEAEVAWLRTKLEGMETWLRTALRSIFSLPSLLCPDRLGAAHQRP